MNAPKQHITEHTERELKVSISQLINMNVGVNDANVLFYKAANCTAKSVHVNIWSTFIYKSVSAGSNK